MTDFLTSRRQTCSFSCRFKHIVLSKWFSFDSLFAELLSGGESQQQRCSFWRAKRPEEVAAGQLKEGQQFSRENAGHENSHRIHDDFHFKSAGGKEVHLLKESMFCTLLCISFILVLHSIYFAALVTFQVRISHRKPVSRSVTHSS